MRIGVFVLAYDEEENITGVLRALREAPGERDVVVIDNASTDATAERARAEGARVLRLVYNVDIGGGRQAGYKYAVAKGYDAVVSMDGDGQHDARFLPSLLQPVLSGQADLVIGSRFLQGRGDQSTWQRRLGIGFFSRLLSLLIGQRVADPTSGFRACNARVARLFAESFPLDFPEPESLAMLARQGLRFVEVPVEMSSREHGQSTVTFLRSIYYMSKITLALLLGSFRRTRCR